MEKQGLVNRIKTTVLGDARDFRDKKIFHQLSLVAFLAWIGLGSDGLSSSCYGPEEAYRVLGSHAYLGVFVAIASAITIFIISASYSQIIELFPTGGGGYLVASKLLSPFLGMVSGCALVIDYIMTITLSIASGAAAIFSFLPPSMLEYRLAFAVAGVIVLIILNLRGIKEAVVPLIPIFMAFVLLHAFTIIYTIVTHSLSSAQVYNKAVNEFSVSYGQLGLAGTIILILKSFSMGAGTFTGIEAVSNGIPILRDPKVKTAHKTMRYIAFSLSIVVLGIMFSYLLFNVQPVEGKTLNAIAFESITAGWNPTIANIFVFSILFSESALLFIAAQTGFLDGPRVLSNMALDRWMPTRFANLSDRLVTKNGILLMGISALILMIVAKGSVSFLLVLYSINVFITFCLSQLGMVRHWWKERLNDKRWIKKITINAIGLAVTTFILITVIIIKFEEGGWVTILVTGSLVFLCYKIKQHYGKTMVLLKRLDEIIDSFDASIYPLDSSEAENKKPEFDPKSKTAVVLVNGYNGLGAHTLLSTFHLFPGMFKNFVFLQVGSVDAGSFKGAAEVEHLVKHINKEANKYVAYMQRSGYFAEAYTSIGTDVVEEISKVAQQISQKYRQPIFFGGQLVFPEDTFGTRFLHNYIVFAVQREFYYKGLPLVILPIRV